MQALLDQRHGRQFQRVGRGIGGTGRCGVGGRIVGGAQAGLHQPGLQRGGERGVVLHADVLAVVPFQFLIVEHRRRLVQFFDAEERGQFLQAEDVAPVLVGAAEVRHVVDQRLGQVAGLAELVHAGGAVALGQLVAVLAEHHGQVAELGLLPPEGVVHDLVQRRGRYPLLRAHHVGYLHEVVVNHVGQVVGGESVRFEEDRIGADVGVAPLDAAEQAVVEDGAALGGYFQADDVRFARSRPGAGFVGVEVAAVAVVALVARLGLGLRGAQ